MAVLACQTALMPASQKTKQSQFHNPVSFEKAVRILRAGKVCAFATETVYGLGADATNCDAVLAIYATKQRPRFNPLIVHCADLEMAHKIALFSPLAEKLTPLWPGAMTLVLPLKPDAGVCDLVSAGLKTVGVRIPGHEQARELIKALGRPLAAPSANPSGQLSPTSSAQVRQMFDDKVPVLEGEPSSAGIESTILSVIDNRIVQLRPGTLPREEIEQKLRVKIELVTKNSKIAAPGMLASHYAPRAQLRLEAKAPEPGEAFLGFGDIGANETIAKNLAKNLSTAGDLEEAARNLFSFLYQLDASGAWRIAVAPIPSAGLGEAINDRLTRAAAPRKKIKDQAPGITGA
ncbi:Threonylcarbamoyl-AMP synthase / SUA5 domain with internal deletion [hydrothermal vent metagenome]|uniref:Threonylcarbamoyl-AMP synthase n=1 Tax=hydrothermal vent metagenome TaxID=652676 RepID=A0A3B0U4A3_9ZZZZ